MKKIKSKINNFTVLIEQDEDGFYMATVPALKSCYTQAKTIEELYPRIKEVIGYVHQYCMTILVKVCFVIYKPLLFFSKNTYQRKQGAKRMFFRHALCSLRHAFMLTDKKS